MYREKLGSGGTSLILKVEVIEPTHLKGEFALRLPLHSEDLPAKFSRGYISYVIDGAVHLKSEGVRIPDILLKERRVFSLASLEDFDLQFYQFMQKPELTPYYISDKQVEKSLIKLAESLYLFEKVDDLHPLQIVYSSATDEAILLDYGKNHHFINSLDSAETAFKAIFLEKLEYERDQQGELIISNNEEVKRTVSNREKRIIKKMKQAILRKRKKMKKQFSGEINKILKNYHKMEGEQFEAYQVKEINELDLTTQEEKVFKEMLERESIMRFDSPDSFRNNPYKNLISETCQSILSRFF